MDVVDGADGKKSPAEEPSALDDWYCKKSHTDEMFEKEKSSLSEEVTIITVPQNTEINLPQAFEIEVHVPQALVSKIIFNMFCIYCTQQHIAYTEPEK